VLLGADFASHLTVKTLPSCALTPGQKLLLAKHF